MESRHPNRSEFHGMTIVVDTNGPKVYIGRCLDQDDREVRFFSADVYEDGQNGRSKENWVRHAARVGVWGRQRGVTVPMNEVASIRLLGDVSSEAGRP